VPRSRRFRVTAPQFRWFALADFISMILIVISGAAVRLTDSGLGCPDWPNCSTSVVTGPVGYHSVIEFGNRTVTVLLVILTAVSVVAAYLRDPRRKDLIWLTWALVGGIVADAVLGAFVVYSKLNPWLVAIHMLSSMGMVVVGATLYHRSKYLYGDGAEAVIRDQHFYKVARFLWIPYAIVIMAGTVTTGAGPHPGSISQQHHARRIDIAFSSAAWIHSIAAVTFIALIAGLLLAIWHTNAPAPLQLGVRRLALIGLLQAAIGFSQYWLHDPAWLVELHILGAVSVTIGVTQLNLRQVARARVPGTQRAK